MTKKMFGVLLTMVMLFGVWGNGAAQASLRFKDVPSSHWANSAINQVAQKGLVKGYSNGTYKPNNNVTRAEFAALLTRILNVETNSSHNFSDVPSSHWVYDEISKGISAGFILPNEYKNNSFEPNKALTRVEMARWMARGLATVDSDYKQAMIDTKDTLLPIPEYYKGGLNKAEYPYVAVAMGTGLLKGYTDGTFGGSKTTTRAEVAVVLVRLLNVVTKSPADFLHLEEFRAVGTEGTNYHLVTNYKQMGDVSFNEVRGEDIKYSRNNVGTAQVHRLIVLDGYNTDTITSAYGPMFYDTRLNGVYDSSVYIILIEKTFQSNIPVDRKFFAAYQNGITDPLVHGYGFGQFSNSNRYGIRTFDSTNASEFFSSSEKYWELGTITRASSMRDGSVANGFTTTSGMFIIRERK